MDVMRPGQLVSQIERERERERGENERERERGGGEREREGERGEIGEREMQNMVYLFLFLTGISGVLAPFSYLVIIIITHAD
jgi:hypothetical protein